MLLFVDADVVVPDTAVATVQACLKDPALSAVIGSYDRKPAAPNFVSQFKNLAHRFVHQQASEEGITFWGACGAIRRTTFLALGGFDERFDVPSIEDIELGLRLSRSGGRIQLRKDLEVTHLKRWTLTSLVRTDVRQRALPWSALLLADGHIPDHLNVSRRARLAVALMVVLLASLLAAPFIPESALVGAIAALVLLARRLAAVAYFASERGWWFALRAVPMQWLYYAVLRRRLCVGAPDRRLEAAARRPSAGARLMHVNPVLIAGAGPAGLTAALELARAGVPVVVHEAEYAVGGIARTETYRGYRFDIGGHRFYTKVAEVERLWHELLGRRADPRAPAVAHLLPGPLLRLPAAAAQRRAQPRADGKRAHDVELPARAAPAGRSRRRRSKTGWSTASASACTRRSSRPTPRRCGACPAA